MNKSLPFLVILWFALLAVAMQPALAQTPAPVKIALAESGDYAAIRWAPGTVISQQDVRISAEQGGRIIWLASIGDEVQSGQILARIDDEALQLDLLNNAARITQLEAQLEYQRNQHQRLQQLAASQNVSGTQLDEAYSQLRVTEQDLNRARIARDQINRQIQLSTVVAPFSGRVVEQQAQAGEYATTGQPLLRFVDVEHREIRVRAPLAVAEYVKEGMEVQVQDDRFEASAMISAVIPVADERSRLFELRLLAIDPRWVIGSAVRVALPISATELRMAVHRDAVIMRGGEMYVYVVDGDETAQRVDVRTGVGIGDQIEVIGNIHEGDRLIIRGGERLQPGQTVQVVQAGELTG